MSNRAWVTLATNDSYGLGALVLAHSLRRAESAFPAVVLITPSVTEAMRARLGEVFAEVIIVDVLDSGDAAHLALLQRPELGITFTKLHCWNLTQYEKCVFLDADTLIVQNCDELFDREELSAAPDVGWPDCFNSGVFVFKPSAETFSSLIKFAQERGSFDGGDQGLLNLYFSDWAHGDINKHLPFLYNVTSAAFYSYLPALKQYGQNLKVIHFIGATKPWLQHYNWRTHSVEAPEHQREFLQLWWSLFVAEVHSKLDTSMLTMLQTGVAGHLARIGEDLQSGAVDELIRRQGWEAGNIDYMGADSFDNIWAKISQTLSQAPNSPPKQQSPPAVTPPAPSPIQGKDTSSIQEPFPVPVEAAVKDLPKEDPLPVPVEKDTEKLASKEPLPVPLETDTNKVEAEKLLPGPVETDTKVLAQTEPLPVQGETDTKNLPSEEPVPEALEKDTNKVLPEESLPVPVDPKELPLDKPVPLSVEAEAKEVPLPVKADKESPVEKQSEQSESETKTLPTETLPAPTQADIKELPSEVTPEPIKTDTKEPPSEVPPQPIKAEDKSLSSEVPASPIKPDTEIQPSEIPSPQAAEPDKEEKSIPEPIKPAVSPSEDKTEIDSDVPVSALEALKLEEKKPGLSDSPPLATTPSKEEATVVPAAKSTEEAAQETRL